MLLTLLSDHMLPTLCQNLLSTLRDYLLSRLINNLTLGQYLLAALQGHLLIPMHQYLLLTGVLINQHLLWGLYNLLLTRTV